MLRICAFDHEPFVHKKLGLYERAAKPAIFYAGCRLGKWEDKLFQFKFFFLSNVKDMV